MKKVISLFLLSALVFSFGSVFAQTGSDWKWQNPTPQGNTLRYVKIWDANTCYIVGFTGTFMKTTNAGVTWTFNHLAGRDLGPSGQKSSMYDAHFFNQNTGIAVGGGSGTAPLYGSGIVRTTNGGTTWDSVTVTPFVTSAIFYQVYFMNDNTGYAVGTTTPKLFKTTDAGLTWNGITTAPTTTLYDVYSPDSLNIIVSTTLGNVHKSTDAGATFSAAISTGVSATLYKMEFADANTGFVSGTVSAFRYTTDAGLTWTTPSNTGLVAAATFYDMDIRSSVVGGSAKLNEGFEDAVFPPAGWTTKSRLGLVIWARSLNLPHTGIASAFNSYETTGGDQWLVTKQINSIAATDSLKFWWKNAFSSAYPPDSIIIRVSTTDTAVASFSNVVARLDGSTMPNVWTEFKYALTSFAGQNIYIAFQHTNTDGNGGYLDDVTVGPVSAPTTQSIIFLTGNNTNIYKSTNMGAMWDTVGFLGFSQPWTSTYYASDFSPTGDSLVTVGALGLINRRLNVLNRTSYTNPVRVGTVYDIWVQGLGVGNAIAVGASSIAGSVFDQISRSTNGGITWSIVPYSTTSRTSFNDIEMIDDNTGYACGTLGAIYKTVNAGANWDSVSTGGVISATYNLAKLEFINANTGWVFSKTTPVVDSSTIFKTTNAGVTWTSQRLSPVFAATYSYQVYSAYMLDANTGYCLNYTPRPYKTTNGGVTWDSMSLIDNYSVYLYGIEMFNANTGYIVGGGGRFYKTTNAGALWDTISVPSRNYSFYALDFINQNIGMVSASSGVTYYTSNGGANWILKNTNSTATMYGCQLLPNTMSYSVGSTATIFKNSTIFTGVAGSVTETPTSFALMQNYPNPFNPTTTISFALPKLAVVTLKIYDVAGREVMRLVNNQQFGAGVQKMQFNGSTLSSGVYFYSLIVDNNLVDTKRMVLVK
ncbi:MAG: YCF48-related protein [Ignavibacteriae bacterium]|nr:YCF48-related protein [Ignavibacteriota bacterium]